MPTSLEIVRQKYAWPGGYLIVAVMDDGDVLCPDCATSEDGVHEGGEPDGWRVDGYMIIEGDPEEDYGIDVCAHCGRDIASL